MKDGVRIVNCARGELVDLDALGDAIESGKVGGASLDVFPGEPVTEHPIFGYENVVVTPHLGASTAEAQDRAGVITAEQVVAALNGRAGLERRQHPARSSSEDIAVLEPYLPLCAQLGRLAMSLAQTGSVDRIEASYRGHLADFDTRLLTRRGAERRLLGPRRRRTSTSSTRPAIAEERGIRVSESEGERVARLREPRLGRGRRRRRADRGRPARRSARATCRTWSRPTGRASTSSWCSTSRCSATPTCRA